jgi:hypothetical protein
MLSNTVTLLKTIVEDALRDDTTTQNMPPPLSVAVLLHTVLLIRDAEAASTNMPPPFFALLKSSTEFSHVSDDPGPAKIAPPEPMSPALLKITIDEITTALAEYPDI